MVDSKLVSLSKGLKDDQCHRVGVGYSVYCVIEIDNKCRDLTLTDAQVSDVSGTTDVDGTAYEPPAQTIPPGNKMKFAHRKTSFSTRGACGVLTYGFSRHSLDRQLQVMWSVPYTHDLYLNWAAAGIGTEAASENLFNSMYQSEQPHGFSRAFASDNDAVFEYTAYDQWLRIKAAIQPSYQCGYHITIKDIKDNVTHLFLKKIDQLIQSQEYLFDWLGHFVKSVYHQDVAVNSVQTATAATGIVGTVLLFTPLAPIGSLMLVGSAAASLATDAAEAVADSVKSG